MELIEAAVSDHDDMAVFYEDTLKVQNNSLIKNFSGLKSNQANSFVDSEVKPFNIRTISLDSFFGIFMRGGVRLH